MEIDILFCKIYRDAGILDFLGPSIVIGFPRGIKPESYIDLVRTVLQCHRNLQQLFFDPFPVQDDVDVNAVTDIVHALLSNLPKQTKLSLPLESRFLLTYLFREPCYVCEMAISPSRSLIGIPPETIRLRVDTLRVDMQEADMLNTFLELEEVVSCLKPKVTCSHSFLMTNMIVRRLPFTQSSSIRHRQSAVCLIYIRRAKTQAPCYS